MLHMLKNSVTFRSDGSGSDTHVVELLLVPHILLPFFHRQRILAENMTSQNKVPISQAPL